MNSTVSAGAKHSRDGESEGEAETPSKKKKLTVSGLPFHHKLIVEAGKEHFRVQIVTVAAWLAGQALDGALITAWTRGCEEMRANGFELEAGLQPSEDELNLVSHLLSLYSPPY